MDWLKKKRKESEKGGKPTQHSCFESQVIYCPRFATGWNFSLAKRGNSNRRPSCPQAAVPQRLPPHTVPSPLLFHSSPLFQRSRWSIVRTDPNKTWSWVLSCCPELCFPKLLIKSQLRHATAAKQICHHGRQCVWFYYSIIWLTF